MTDAVNDDIPLIPASVIAAELKIVGDLVSAGRLIVRGSIDGSAVAVELDIDEGAIVNGVFRSQMAKVAGQLTGELLARVVTLAATAQIDGVIEQTSLCIAEGAVVTGTFRKGQALDSPKTATGS